MTSPSPSRDTHLFHGNRIEHLMANEDPLRFSDSTPRTSRTAAEIQDWLVNQLTEELQINRDKIKIDQPILAQGIDSMHAVAVVAQLEDWLDIRFSSNPLEDYPSIEALSQSLARRRDDRPSVN